MKTLVGAILTTEGLLLVSVTTTPDPPLGAPNATGNGSVIAPDESTFTVTANSEMFGSALT
jgi:hypothetical protein